MALFIYRFRLKIPALVSQLEVEVGVSLSITDHSGGGIVDIECDDSRSADLLDSMVERGYEFVEGSPTTVADARFRADNNIIGPGEHRAQDQLVHGVAEDGYEEYSYTGNQLTAAVVWTDDGMTVKIREELFAYTTGRLSQVVTKQYDAGGLLVETLTEDYTYTGNKLTVIDRVLT